MFDCDVSCSRSFVLCLIVTLVAHALFVLCLIVTLVARALLFCV